MANSNPSPSPSRSSSPNPNPNPGPNPSPSPPKESKWRGPMMDAYGEPIGGGTFYTGAKDGGESNVVTR